MRTPARWVGRVFFVIVLWQMVHSLRDSSMLWWHLTHSGMAGSAANRALSGSGWQSSQVGSGGVSDLLGSSGMRCLSISPPR